MTEVTIAATTPEMFKDPTKVLRPVRGETLRAFSSASNHLAVAKRASETTGVVAYENMGYDGILLTPAGGASGTDRVFYFPVRPSSRARYLTVHMIAQASVTNVDPSVEISLFRVSDGTVIDAGYAVPLERLLHPRLFSIYGSFVAFPEEGASQTLGARLLNVDNEQGVFLMVKVETTNVRVLSGTVIEYVENPQEQEFV